MDIIDEGSAVPPFHEVYPDGDRGESDSGYLGSRSISELPGYFAKQIPTGTPDSKRFLFERRNKNAPEATLPRDGELESMKSDG